MHYLRIVYTNLDNTEKYVLYQPVNNTRQQAYSLKEYVKMIKIVVLY